MQKYKFGKNFYKPHRVYYKHKKTKSYLKNVFVTQFSWQKKLFWPSFRPKFEQKVKKYSYSKMITETEKIKEKKSVQNQILQSVKL